MNEFLIAVKKMRELQKLTTIYSQPSMLKLADEAEDAVDLMIVELDKTGAMVEPLKNATT